MPSSPPPQPVLEAEWDYMIVLDAMRYDVFEDTYEEYFEGDLAKYRSPGSATPAWAANTFPDEYDITYVSSIPFINSRPTPITEMKWGASCGYEWTAADHFSEVVDVWETDWNEDIATVLPEPVTEAARDHLANGHRGERMIVHYIQPHTPFLEGGHGRKLASIRQGVLNPPKNGAADGPVQAVRETLEAKLAHVPLAQRLGILYDLNRRGLKQFLSNGFEETFVEYYYENTHVALEAAAELAAELDGDVVVTADHGEAFGEEGYWGHQVGLEIPALLDVPWLDVDEVKA